MSLRPSELHDHLLQPSWLLTHKDLSLPNTTMCDPICAVTNGLGNDFNSGSCTTWPVGHTTSRWVVPDSTSMFPDSVVADPPGRAAMGCNVQTLWRDLRVAILKTPLAPPANPMIGIVTVDPWTRAGKAIVHCTFNGLGKGKIWTALG